MHCTLFSFLFSLLSTLISSVANAGATDNDSVLFLDFFDKEGSCSLFARIGRDHLEHLAALIRGQVQASRSFFSSLFLQQHIWKFLFSINDSPREFPSFFSSPFGRYLHPNGVSQLSWSLWSSKHLTNEPPNAAVLLGGTNATRPTRLTYTFREEDKHSSGEILIVFNFSARQSDCETVASHAAA